MPLSLNPRERYITDDLRMNAEEKSEIEPEFNRALRLRDSGDWLGAAAILERIDAEYPNKAAVLGMWGSIYFHLKDWERAIALYRRTVSLSPKSELASLCLFHSLRNVGKYEEALVEMGRFLSVSDSAEYRQLIKEMNEET